MDIRELVLDTVEIPVAIRTTNFPIRREEFSRSKRHPIPPGPIRDIMIIS